MTFRQIILFSAWILAPITPLLAQEQTPPANIPGAKSTELSAWPKTLKEIATALGTAAKSA